MLTYRALAAPAPSSLNTPAQALLPLVHYILHMRTIWQSSVQTQQSRLTPQWWNHLPGSVRAGATPEVHLGVRQLSSLPLSFSSCLFSPLLPCFSLSSSLLHNCCFFTSPYNETFSETAPNSQMLADVTEDTS